MSQNRNPNLKPQVGEIYMTVYGCPVKVTSERDGVIYARSYSFHKKSRTWQKSHTFQIDKDTGRGIVPDEDGTTRLSTSYRSGLYDPSVEDQVTLDSFQKYLVSREKAVEELKEESLPETVSRAEFEALQARLVKLDKLVYGYLTGQATLK
jgi:hypothetical protein